MRKLKLFLSMLMLIAFSVGNVWAGQVTISPSQALNDGGVDPIAVACAKGDGTSNPAISGGQLRLYQAASGKTTGNTITFSSTYSITSIVFTFANSMTASNGSFSEGSYNAENFTWTGSTTSLTLTVTGTTSSTRIYITNMVVTYDDGGGSTTCADPIFSPAAGSYEGTQTVTISCSTDEAVIHYTTDGTDPTASSPTYSAALSVSTTQTIKAIAMKDGLDNSEIVTAAYTITEGPDVTLNLIDGNWGFPTSNTTEDGTYTNSVSGYSVTCHAPTNYKVSGSDYFFIGKSGAYILLPEFTSPIEKIVVSGNSGGAADVAWNIYQGETAVSTAASGCKNDAYTFDIAPANQKANVAHSIKVTNAKNLQIKVIKIYFGEAAAVEAPTISGETPFVTTTTVTLGCATDGASIYYTTDGTDPTSSSSLYENPFELNASATVKAIAILSSDQSSIASKEFEKVTSYTTLADIFAKAEEVGSTATDIYVTFGGWKVSAKTNNNAFLTDGTNGAVIYGSGHGFNAGDVLTGTVACKVQLYKGFAELTALTSGTTGLTVTPGSVGDPVVKTWDQLSAVNTGALVKLENLSYDGSSLSDGVNTIPTYTTFYTATFEAGKSYNLTGVYQYYDTDGQILPRSAADVEEIVETFTVTYDNAPEHGTLTIKNGDDVVTSGSAVNEGTILDIVTNPAEGYTLEGVTVNGSAYAESTLTLTENVTISATFVVNEAPLVTTYILSEIGVETSHLNGEHVGDKVNLPLTAAECSKTFRGWSANASCTVAPEYAPGAQITLAANNKFYAVYATPGDNASTEVFATTSLGSTNTVTEGYAVSAAAGAQTGYYQDGGSVGQKRHVQVMVSNTETQIIPSQPSAITVTAKIGGGSTFDALVNPVYAILLNASGEEIGDPVALTSAIEVKEGKDYTVNMAAANYADVRGVRVYHVKENKSGSGFNVRYYSISLSYATESYSDYSTDCQVQVATPTFSPAAGTYTEAQTVTISCATEEATIYYTTNGDEPTASSTEYTAAISVGENMTIKAIAVKAGMANSAVATAEYTINLPLSTMDQIFAAATAAGSTATDANIAFNNWVVSGVSTNGKNVFVTDGTKGFIIFDNGGEMGFAVGDVLSGTAACKVQLYNGAAELTTLSSTTEGLNIAKEGVITPSVKAISALSGVNTGAAVTINSVQFDGEYLSDGANEIKPYNSLFGYEALENGKYYNVTGIYQQFGNTTKEILPRSAADIEEVDLADPEISYTPASATIELGEDLPGTVFANPHELAISYSSNNEAVATVSNTGVIALGTATGTAVITASFAGDATYAAANVTYTITVNPASVSENVVILAVYDTKYYAMSTTHITSSNAFTAIEVEYDGSQVTVASEADKAAIQWTKKTSGENHTFQTKDEDHKYMKGTSSGAAMTLDANVCNWSWDVTNEYYYIGSRTFLYQNGVGFKNYAATNIDKTGYSGKAQVIAIAAENIIITSKADPQLAYDPTSVTLTVGGAFTPATLNYAEGFDGLAAVTYASNNEGVATVDESGVVSLVADAIGTATITATFDGNNNYLAGSASYTITVNEAGDDLSGTWTRVTSVAAGQRIIIAGTYNAKTMAMGKQNSNNRAAVLSTLDGDVLTPGAATKVFTLVDAGEGHFAIQASNGKYLNAAGTGSSNYLKEADDYEAASAKWTITFDENGANIVATSTGNRNVIRYNSSSGSELFSCYAAGGQRAINIYSTSAAPEPDYGSYQRDVTCGNYGTICLPKAGTISGAILFDIADYENNMIYVDQVIGGAMEAGKPYIFYATSGQLNVAYTSNEEVAAGEANGLYGFYNLANEDAQKDLEEDAGNYILYQNAYWLVSGRAAYIANYRAYIKIDQINYTAPVPGRRRVAMAVNGKQTTTGCELINAAEAPVKMLINGQLFILRGEKMYNVNGQIVK